MARYKIANKIKNGKLVQDVTIITKKSENQTISRIDKTLIKLNEPKLKRFPYQDCYKIHEKVKNRRRLKTSNGITRRRFSGTYQKIAGHIIPNLVTYFSHIDGLAMSVEQLDKRNLEQLKQWIKPLEKSFFEIWKQHLSIEKIISPRATPHLYKLLKLHDDLRCLLLPFMSKIIDEKQNISLLEQK